MNKSTEKTLRSPTSLEFPVSKKVLLDDIDVLDSALFLLKQQVQDIEDDGNFDSRFELLDRYAREQLEKVIQLSKEIDDIPWR